ncbi:hypothetical protein FRB96_001385 [Tulasnella sp. 330]|nr:hypothetical protein FRB96_001385 [Tulasnella sp. 330]KAG8888990.1 hypothetical protein FRB98_006254 [Tulasnella sp. 332]
MPLNENLFSPKASEVEIHVEGTLFSVHINPYFLRLHLPANVIEDDASSAQYDPGAGYLTITLTKENKGEDFKDLDMLTKLLVPPGVWEAESRSRDEGDSPRIEVLGGSDVVAGDGHLEDAFDKLSDETRRMRLNGVEGTPGLDLEEERAILLEAEKRDWSYPQAFEDNSGLSSSSTVPSLAGVSRPYGFLDSYSGYFKHVTYSDNEVNELGPDAEHLTSEERRSRREENEDKKWDPEYYLADYVNDEDIQGIIQWKSPYDPSNPVSEIEFTEEENAVILRLPRKEYLITPTQTHALYLTLVNVLFSYAYDHRTTQNDPTPESAWTICSLTPAFSALDTSPSLSPSPSRSPNAHLTSTLVASYRRALAFPLYRNWELCERCREDVVDIMSRGRRCVTRALLRLKRILDRHETYYVYSKIWVNDYVVWVQAYASDLGLTRVGLLLQNTAIPKYALGWDLKELEDSAAGFDPDSDDEDELDDGTLQPALL